jgi:hypothetical protein
MVGGNISPTMAPNRREFLGALITAPVVAALAPFVLEPEFVPSRAIIPEDVARAFRVPEELLDTRYISVSYSTPCHHAPNQTINISLRDGLIFSGTVTSVTTHNDGSYTVHATS